MWGWSCVPWWGLVRKVKLCPLDRWGSSATSSSRRQCDGGGRSALFLILISIYKLCQLSALSASILRLPEQTKTGALRLSQASKLPEQTETGATLEKGGWRRVLLAEAYLIYYHNRFCFFWLNCGWYIFWMYEGGYIRKRLALGCVSWWMFFRNHRGVQIPLPLMQRLNIHEYFFVVL